MESLLAFAVVVTAATLLVTTCCFVIGACYQTVWFYWLSPLRIKKIMERQGVHSPKPRPLVGNLLDMASMVASTNYKDLPSIHHDLVPRLLPHYVLWSKIYGNRFIYWNGFEPRLCLTDMNMIKEFLSKHSYSSGKSWLQRQGSKNFVGDGLLMANGDNWHRQRHLVAPAFMADKLKGYAVHVLECTRSIVQSLEDQAVSGRTEVEIGGVMARLTADIISRIEFGDVFEKGKRIFELLKKLQRLCAQSTRHLCLPGSRFFPSKYNQSIKALKAEVDTQLQEIIDSRMDDIKMKQGNSHGNDLLGILLDGLLKDNGLLSMDNKQLIMDECKTFFFPGHETTALLLTWTMMLLASKPSWQDKVREEVAQVCDGCPRGDHLHKLSLLNLVINESMRLYPPATVLPRMAFKDVKLGDLFIPKGLSIWIPVLAINHSEELWGKDANEFNPQRFASRTFTPGCFIPFCSGPRNCIGQTFAMMEAKIILATLVSRFRFSISESYRHAPVVIMTIKPKYGIQILLEPVS